MKKFNQVLKKGLEKTYEVQAKTSVKLNENASQKVGISFEVKAHNQKEADQKAIQTFESLKHDIAGYTVKLKS